jgi:hypothetical protein
MNKLFQDLAFGEEQEKVLIEYLESNWYQVIKNEDKAVIDFQILDKDWRKINLEIKWRRNESTKYDTTIIWANKMAEAFNTYYKTWEITLFIFWFTDWLFYLNPFITPPEAIEYKLFRYDRPWLDKPKWWLLYNIKHLTKIWTKLTTNSEEQLKN